MKHFCTCDKTKCPLHPNNHDKGCSPCIEKNLKTHEVPNCFFDNIGVKERANDSYEEFAKAVLSLEQEK
ncbi:MAG: hypothetical protein J5562_02640 [Clostridia bacterium]|nr:hypothetical protein [Clostridia bacterium]